MLYLDTKKNRECLYQSIFNIGMVGIVALTLFGCGDFRDEPQPPTPTSQPPVESPKPPETPKTPQTPEKNPSLEKMNQMCEAERQWALTARLIDINQLRLFQGRNFAPIFNTPGERQSGIEGWIPCQKALEANGFITN